MVLCLLWKIVVLYVRDYTGEYACKLSDARVIWRHMLLGRIQYVNLV